MSTSTRKENGNMNLIIVMGTSGSGKSTIGLLIARAINAPFIDGDSLHPKANIEKMSSGVGLNDQDRIPWLEKIRMAAHDVLTGKETEWQEFIDISTQNSTIPNTIVIGCSALKKSYRQILRGRGNAVIPEASLHTWFIYLNGTRVLLLNRMLARGNHFFGAGLLDSQLETLEKPEKEERVAWIELGAGEEGETERGVEAVARDGIDQITRWRI